MAKQRRRVLVLSPWLRPQMAAGLARFARMANWHLHLETTLTGETARDVACDGMLVFHCNQAELIALARRRAASCPAVLISGMKPILRAPTVREDNVAVGRMAAEHFLQRGFRQFVWLSKDNRRVSQDRRAGFLAALRENEGHCHCIEWSRTRRPQWREYSRWVGRQLAGLPRPIALLAQDDLAAVDAVQICKDNGLRVPDDVAVLGVGNDALLCEFSDVPLSSIELDWEETVYHAAAILERLMSGGRPPKEAIVFPPRRVVTRVSTDILAVPQAGLAAALRFVREHFREPITVSDVARAVGVTRRTLENHFRRHLHTGLAEEIRRRRLDYVQDCLIKTDMTIAEIALQSGFESAVSLAKVFKRVQGIQPSRYRQAHRRPAASG
jgi:LacI family transcriptional regulator